VVGTTLFEEFVCNPFPNCVQVARAFAWISRRGMIDLQVELESLGLDLTGWSLTAATGVSADGTVIVGRGIDPSGDAEAWRAEVPSLAWPRNVPALPGRALLLLLAAVIAAAAAFTRHSLASANG
jgi:hypothetical protein